MGKLTQMFGDKDPYPMKISTFEVVDNQARRKVKKILRASTKTKIGDAHGPPDSTGPAYCSLGFTKPKPKPDAVAMNSESFDIIDLEFNGEEITSISHIIFKGKEKDDSKVK